jgi:hypothetical protein
MSASTVRAPASSGAIPHVVTEHAVRSAIFRACLTHPDTFLSDASTDASHAQTLVSALLSTFVGFTEPLDNILCVAFAAADACNLRRAQLAAAAVAPVRVAEALAVTGPPKDNVYPLGFRYMNGCCTAVTPDCEPLGAIAVIPSPEGAELAGAQSVQPGVVE